MTSNKVPVSEAMMSPLPASTPPACQAVSSLPSGESRIGGGSATVNSEGVTTASGGQAVYVKVKNANVLGVAYTLTIARDVTPGSEVCTYGALLPPGSSAILSGAFFADPPIGWKITVAVAEQSDAGVLTYDVYSQTGSSRNSRKQSKRQK